MKIATGPMRRELLDRDAGEVEGPQELGLRRQALEPRLVAAAQGLDHPAHRHLGPRPDGRLADRAVAEQAPRDEERPADLLVRGDRHRRESRRRGELRGLDKKARLADARLTLERDRGQPALGLANALLDRRQLDAPPDDRAGRAAQLHGEGALRLDERIERLALQEPHRGRVGRRRRHVRLGRLGCLAHYERSMRGSL